MVLYKINKGIKMKKKEEIKQPSLAKGDELNQETWKDFVSRLHHDCIGKGVEDHYTADASFTVKAKRLIFGIDLDYTDKKVICCEDSHWFSPQEYWDDLTDEEREELDVKSQDEYELDFLTIDEYFQWDMLGDLEDHSVVGWDEEWEYVNAHFTKDAADAFIKRKKHDYPNGMKVYVESQYHCWEFNTIKQAILDGTLIYNDETK
jgi:hypothetical protein